MKLRVVGEFGVEGRTEAAPFADGDGLALVFADRVDVGAAMGDDGGADEDGGHGFGDAVDIEGVLERVNLRAEGVTADGDVEEAEGELVGPFLDLFCKQDHAHAGAPDGEAAFMSFSERLVEPGSLHEHADGRAFAAGDDEAGDVLEVFGRPNLLARSTDLAEGIEVALEVTLEGQDADVHGQ